MALVNMKKLLYDAEIGNYSVGSFSVANMEMVIGAIKAAEELKSPIIIQIAEVRLNHSPLHLIGPLMIEAAKKATVPVAVHFDHGLTLEKIKEALEIGFTSVMIDGSKLSLDENINLTNKAKELANMYNASIEAEIGIVGGSEDGSENIKMIYTDPLEAKKFFEETNVDALAVAIGNAHGVYKYSPKLNIDILKEIRDKVKAPLVLHGGTGITEDDFRACTQNGIRKINVATATFNSVAKKISGIYKYVENNEYFDIHQAEIQGAYENVKKHIKIFGSKNKA
ncbi:class II aldolase [Clostridium tertium]|uniref:Fructose-bisphosphate aldolase n=1 Tax=Clostridium tertium TaxID=1559 RepID=A0A6N3E463_9CLOT